MVSAGLEDLHSMSGSLITKKGCKTLDSALSSNPSNLRKLDLSCNHPGDSRVKLLSAGLEESHCKQDTLSIDRGGLQRPKCGVRKYACELELDTNTANRNLKLSDSNRMVTYSTEDQSYPDHPERFVCPQLMCTNRLTGLYYWEVKWTGMVEIAVTYRGIRRNAQSNDCVFGMNDQSWSLSCSDVGGYSVCHNKRKTSIPSSTSSSVSHRVGVHVNCLAGILSFYEVSLGKLIPLHTFNTTFTDPVYPGFGFWSGCSGSSVSLCSL
ncbi:stonustoxin subunit beta-like [Micropterus dolomieu]|uniref:stonustoxin subunit beta-like n=1 Tax=Micropterus dolomieu TaxID=147949 RepID=UPI001E8CF661|nr:stonustoxin subunit beta-like [Micropterus dolomieu]